MQLGEKSTRSPTLESRLWPDGSALVFSALCIRARAVPPTIAWMLISRIRCTRLAVPRSSSPVATAFPGDIAGDRP